MESLTRNSSKKLPAFYPCKLALAVAALTGTLILPQVAWSVDGSVQPPTVSLTIRPGQSATVNKAVTVPEIPPVLDFCLLVDLTGSYIDDLPNLKGLAPGIFTAIRDQVADSMFCLGSFRDFPFLPWGYSGDFAYRLNQNLTVDQTTWTSAVNGLSADGGADGPEAQYEALYQMATGGGRNVPPPAASLGDIDPGQNPSFRASASKVIAITTDASFHVSGDSQCSPPNPCPFPYPGPSRDDTVAALNAAKIKVIAIKAPGSTDQMDDVATATGGSVVTTSSSSAEIATAILAGLAAIPQTVTATPVGCAPLEITFDPPSQTVTGPVTVSFVESITVPSSTLAQKIECEVVFKSNDAELGKQKITVAINSPPNCSKATPSTAVLWPPNHQFASISILGVTDPNGDSVNIKIDSILQDEAVNANGSGNTAPDGRGVGTSAAQVRAERIGDPKVPGNGRVYHIGFTADDGLGASCTGGVLVGVPHNQGTTPIDDGAIYDSTISP